MKKVKFNGLSCGVMLVVIMVIGNVSLAEIALAQTVACNGETLVPNPHQYTTTTSLGSAGEKDYYRIEIPAPNSGGFAIYTTGSTNTVGRLLYRPTPSEEYHEIADDPCCGNFEILEYDRDPGQYCVEVSGYFGATGGYTLHIQSDVKDDDHGSGLPCAANPTIVPSDDTDGLNGELFSKNDKDYFQIQVQQDGAELELFTTGSTDTVGRLFYRADSTQEYDPIPGAFDPCCGNFRISLSDRPAGFYCLEVSGYFGAIGKYTAWVVGDYIARPAVCGGLDATIVGTKQDEVLRGTEGPDIIAALGGNDVVLGFGGNDRLCRLPVLCLTFHRLQPPVALGVPKTLDLKLSWSENSQLLTLDSRRSSLQPECASAPLPAVFPLMIANCFGDPRVCDEEMSQVGCGVGRYPNRVSIRWCPSTSSSCNVRGGHHPIAQ